MNDSSSVTQTPIVKKKQPQVTLYVSIMEPLSSEQRPYLFYYNNCKTAVSVRSARQYSAPIFLPNYTVCFVF